ncbi:FAD-dependent oxidoreductase [Agromyces mangrovi Wang et al. 2018]|uniref:FAD-dependent oxidoreductase n=1 Tax=Agromyces mangrovi TaxID=1858653 RepID=UPI00257458DA|nr:NAD(P)/FAD-dependent oxidoreductase [Agromyces mangrovi]BDZ64483.1 oxidoreductase [Agromyces mangrovi]
MGAGLTPEGAPTLDVAIVGGGPVGLLLACLLAQRGLRVDVFEQRAEPAPLSRAIGVHPPGLRALDAVGVGEAARQSGVAIRDGRVSCRGRVLGALDFAEADPDVPFVLALPQAETERLLAERLAQLRPGALHRGVRVSAIRQLDGGVEFAVDGAGADASGRRAADEGGGATDGGIDAPATLAARYLVGADGVRSGVRRQARIGWQQHRGRADYVMGDVADRTDAPGSALLHFEPGGVVESFPLPGGMRRWVAMTEWGARDAGVDRPGASAALIGIVAERTGDDLGTDVPDARAFTARQHLADRVVAGRIVLVGDAAHEVSPIGGQGMNLGWLDALHLDRALAACLADPPGAAAALAEYERARHRAAGRAIRQAAFNMSMGAPAHGLRLAARNAAVRLLAVGPARRRLARAFTMRGL